MAKGTQDNILATLAANPNTAMLDADIARACGVMPSTVATEMTALIREKKVKRTAPRQYMINKHSTAGKWTTHDAMKTGAEPGERNRRVPALLLAELRSENAKLKRKATRATNEARACEARLATANKLLFGLCGALNVAPTISHENMLELVKKRLEETRVPTFTLTVAGRVCELLGLPKDAHAQPVLGTEVHPVIEALEAKLRLLAEYESTKTTLKSIVSEGITVAEERARDTLQFTQDVYQLLGLDENITFGVALNTLRGKLIRNAGADSDVVFVTPNDLQKKILTFLKLDPATATAEDVATAFVAISDKLMAYALIQKGLHELLGLPSRQDDAMLLSNVREKINAASHYSRLCGTLAEIRNALHLPTEATTDAILAAVVHNRKEAADAAADAYLDAGEARLIENLVTLLQLDADMENDEELASPVEAVTDAVADLLHDRDGLNEQTKKLARELADVRADRDRAFARDREQAARIDDQDEQLRTLRLELLKLASTAALLGEEAQRMLRQASSER